MIQDIETKKFSIKADILITNLRDSSWYSFKQLESKIERIKNHLASDVTIIPARKTLFICPIMAHNLASNLNVTDPVCDIANKIAETDLQNDYERIYQVLLKRYYLISRPMESITINYNKCSGTNDRKNQSRMSTLTYLIEQDCVLNGFVGFFETYLCDNIVLKEQRNGINDTTHGSMWFPAFFPVEGTQQLKKGDQLEANFWLCANTSRDRMWFEWCTTKPTCSFIHNQNGDACFKNILPTSSTSN